MANLLLNIQLLYIEATKEFKALEAFIEEALYVQWESAIQEGLEELIEELSNPDVTRYATTEEMVADLKVKVRAYVETHMADIQDPNGIFYAALVKLASKGGQHILDDISDATNTTPKTFQLKDLEILEMFEDRVAYLYEVIRETSVKNMTTSLSNSIFSNMGDDTKAVLAATLGAVISRGVADSKNRAKLIAVTEVNAAYEKVKEETAKKNGFTLKTWYADMDERTCKLCVSNNGETLPMEDPFASGHFRAPAHVNCRCQVVYLYQNDWEGKIQKDTKGNPSIYYDEFPTVSMLDFTSPDIVWNGSEYVGKDKSLVEYVDNIKPTALVKQILVMFNGKLLLDTMIEDGDIPDDKNIKELVDARKTLTDIGFLQLVMSLGYIGSINTYKGRPAPAIPNRSYNEKDELVAQNEVYNMADELGNIYIENTNYSVTTIPEGNWTDGEVKKLSARSLTFSKKKLSAKRVISIIDNFNEAQRRGGMIDVYRNTKNQLVIGSDGNHRLLAAKVLGITSMEVRVHEPIIRTI